MIFDQIRASRKDKQKRASKKKNKLGRNLGGNDEVKGIWGGTDDNLSKEDIELFGDRSSEILLQFRKDIRQHYQEGRIDGQRRNPEKKRK